MGTSDKAQGADAEPLCAQGRDAETGGQALPSELLGVGSHGVERGGLESGLTYHRK